MKKILLLLLLTSTLFSCYRERLVDVQFLQQSYETVYHLADDRYVVIDSTGVYDLKMGYDGQVVSLVKIK